ncbi:MAG: acetate--CoA ligase family protein [Bacillota bacterium]|nr:acetate--CoA ligase family protein [Bacillota bacterium]
MGKQQLQKLGIDSPSDLEAFFYPESIAVLGASQNPLKPNGIPLYLLSMFGYLGDVYPVNPKYDRVGGLKCYPSVRKIKEPVDLAIIGVPAVRTMEVLEECAEKKVKAAIVFTSGFAEIGSEGREQQTEMRKLAKRSGMRILGPNCLGILNYYNGNMASFFYNQERNDLIHPEMLSFITQSGGLGGIIYQMIVQLSIGFNYFVSTGNEADVSFAEILNYLVDRDEVSIIAGYLEGLQGDGKLFVEACRKALERKKMVTMLKVGKTPTGAAAAASHTGALVGEDLIYEGVFRQYGVPRAEDVEQMNALIALKASGRMPAGKRMAVITISGGGGVVVADKCPEYGLEVVRLSGETQLKLREFFPSFGSVVNPVDLTSQLFIDTGLFQKALRLVMQDPGVDVGGFFYNLEMPDPEAGKKIIEVYNEIDKPLVVFTWPTGQDYALEAKNSLVMAGIPVIEHIPSGLWAISALADWVRKTEETMIFPATETTISKAKAKKIIGDNLSHHSQSIAEWQAKKILKAYDIPVTREILAADPQEAVKAAKSIGYPLVLKVISPQILHKSDIGCVVLNISNEEELVSNYNRVMENARKHNPDASIEGILVQEMLNPGQEMIVGIKNDPVFGPAVLLGLGGVFVEVLKDVSTRLAPLSEKDAREMINELKGSAILYGTRGRAEADLDAIVSVLVTVSRLAVDLEDEIAEMDINPLMVYEKGSGVVVADALLVLKN